MTASSRYTVAMYDGEWGILDSEKPEIALWGRESRHKDYVHLAAQALNDRTGRRKDYYWTKVRT